MEVSPGDVPRRFADAWNRNDADGIAELFAEDAEFVNVVGLWWRKRSDIRRAHEYGLRTFFRGASMSIRRVEERRLGADVAVVHAKWRLAGQTGVDGSDADVRRGVLLFVLQRRGGEWIVVAAQNTDIVPGAESIVAEGARRYAVDYREEDR